MNLLTQVWDPYFTEDEFPNMKNNEGLQSSNSR